MSRHLRLRSARASMRKPRNVWSMLTAEERSQPPALWGGVECTVNRVGDQCFDAVQRSGHDRRISDLDLFASLGLRALRYPILWERVAPNGLEDADWSWPDARLNRIRDLGMEPIVGLLHHGNGPADTSLLDPAFPEKFAAYARAVAQRYPWVTTYLPINEPLTTARFTGLYGHWYPHKRDSLSWAKILLTQCRAVVLAMQAIRGVVPQAQFILNEDIGTTFSTPALAYQADFENERRWLAYDLLCGRVHSGHPMSQYLRWIGIAARDLRFFEEHPSPPDVIGIDYYVTSERFLDHRVARYPASVLGGNVHERYADVEAVRVRPEGIAGLLPLLREVWTRYGLPVAVTEAHLGASVTERMRWLWEIWSAARMARAEGIDVQAVTAWALLGNYDWDSLVTRINGHYEAGVFEMQGDCPCPTGLSEMLQMLASCGDCDAPALNTPGWWRRPERLLYSEAPRSNNCRYAVR